MTEDDFIRALQQTWQSQDHGASEVLQRLRRKRWQAHRGLAAAMLVCTLGVLAGLGFAWAAIHPGPTRLLFALSSAVILISSPAVAVAVARALKSSLAWNEEPQALLRIGMHRAEGNLRVFRVQRRHIGLIGVFVALLWVCQAAGLLHALGFLVFYTVLCAAVCAAAWLYMMWQEPRVRGEHAACARLLAMMEDQEPMAPAEALAESPDEHPQR